MVLPFCNWHCTINYLENYAATEVVFLNADKSKHKHTSRFTPGSWYKTTVGEEVETIFPLRASSSSTLNYNGIYEGENLQEQKGSEQTLVHCLFH